MVNAKIIVVKLNTIARTGNEFQGPIDIASETDFRPAIQYHFDNILKGIAGYILLAFQGKLFQCERNNVDVNKPYIQFEIAYHPLFNRFREPKGLLKGP